MLDALGPVLLEQRLRALHGGGAESGQDRGGLFQRGAVEIDAQHHRRPALRIPQDRADRCQPAAVDEQLLVWPEHILSRRFQIVQLAEERRIPRAPGGHRVPDLQNLIGLRIVQDDLRVRAEQQRHRVAHRPPHPNTRVPALFHFTHIWTVRPD